MSESGNVSSSHLANSAQTKTNKIYPDVTTTDVDQTDIATNNDTRNRKNGKLKNNEKTKIMVKAQKDSCHTCENIPEEDGCITKFPCYQKLHNSFCFKVFVFLLMFCLDAVDLVSDWLLYHDVATTEQGLVYGPPEDVLIWLLLAFSIVGSLTFSFEVVNLWWEIFRNNPWIDSDLMSAITTWIEDVPQIVISVMIVACREEAISYFQLVKASVVIVGAIIRITVTLIKYCSKRALCELHNAGKVAKYRHHVVYRILIMLGLFVTLAGSVTIFMFTQSERNPDGSINFKVPHSVIIGEFDDQKYFHNVSIFFSHPLFNMDHTSAIPENDVNWVRMAKIYDVREIYEDGLFRVKYDNATKQKIMLTLTSSKGNVASQDCFQFNRGTGAITLQSCNTFFSAGIDVIEFIFKFHYKKPETPNLIFGDIKYNVLVKENSKCHGPLSTIYEDVVDRLSDTQNAALHYFRTRPGVPENRHVLYSGGTVQYYRANNLIDISEVWRTGFATCKSTGSLAPHVDSNIEVSCT